ncbi:hypothetical protein [uncultured Campylobacter sp.]|uniref:hypothetical protein n=1 Tax=uncultured Campylobacter sp. TaxID=218934 RepID=UPI002625A779|nr:hypothetical protein [uncultured Campylobacter sp.]
MTEPKIGDLFAVKLKRRDAYFIAQILSAQMELVALVLDGFSSAPLGLKEATKLKPFYFDHHFWKRGEFYLGVDEILDAEPVFIGNAALICEPPECVSLQNIEQIYMQLAWNELPKDIRAKFKSVRKQKLEISQPQSREFYADLARKNPFCYEIKSKIWDENLKNFLEATPMMTQLELSCAGKSLDISRTHLQQLVLHASGTEEIALNGSLWQFVINGDIARLKSVHCPFDGELLSVQLNLNGGGFCIRGLEKLRNLQIFSRRGECVDLARVAASFPNLREIFINAQGGTLKNIDTLAKFEHLKDVWLSDVYGFERFPTRAQLPHLKRLCFWSVPKGACEAARAQFKGIESLVIKQPRSKQWLAANLNNPLRGWDGRDGVGAATARKAMRAYAGAHKKLSTLEAKPASSELKTEKTEILKEFIAVFNAIDAKHSIDTMEREEIWEAFCKLAELAAADAKSQERIWEQNAEF